MTDTYPGGDLLPENWERGRFYESESPQFQHEHLDAEVRISHDEVDYDSDGEQLPEGETREAFYIWITNGVPFAASEMDFDPPEPITSLDEALEWADELMRTMDEAFALDNHHYVGVAMNEVLGTSEYNDSGTMDAPEDYSCPICGVPLDLFRGAGTYEQIQHHLEYTDDEQHEGVSVSLEERGSDDGESTAAGDTREKTCDLCGDESSYLHSVTSEPGLPTEMQSRMGLCSACHDALEAATGGSCAWCGADNTTTMTVVGHSDGQYNLGRLCLDCQGVSE